MLARVVPTRDTTPELGCRESAPTAVCSVRAPVALRVVAVVESVPEAGAKESALLEELIVKAVEPPGLPRSVLEFTSTLEVIALGDSCTEPLLDASVRDEDASRRLPTRLRKREWRMGHGTEMTR